MTFRGRHQPKFLVASPDAFSAWAVHMGDLPAMENFMIQLIKLTRIGSDIGSIGFFRSDDQALAGARTAFGRGTPITIQLAEFCYRERLKDRR